VVFYGDSSFAWRRIILPSFGYSHAKISGFAQDKSRLVFAPLLVPQEICETQKSLCIYEKQILKTLPGRVEREELNLDPIKQSADYTDGYCQPSSETEN
jgi:hypothetical protein